VVLKRTEVDPDSIGKDQRYGDDFKIEVFFSNICEKCKNSEMKTKDLCSFCTREMDEDIKGCWNIINSILNVSCMTLALES